MIDAAAKLPPEKPRRKTKRMPKEMMTVERLKKHFHYDPETGLLTNLISGRHPRCKRHGHLIVKFGKRIWFVHRLAWLYVHGRWPKEETDHINQIKDDNRLVNLREATTAENQWNRGLGKTNKSGRKGVSWHRVGRCWNACIQFRGKTHHLGSYRDLDEAGKAYDKAAAELHREFALTNEKLLGKIS